MQFFLVAKYIFKLISELLLTYLTIIINNLYNTQLTTYNVLFLHEIDCAYVTKKSTRKIKHYYFKTIKKPIKFKLRNVLYFIKNLKKENIYIINVIR